MNRRKRVRWHIEERARRRADRRDAAIRRAYRQGGQIPKAAQR